MRKIKMKRKPIGIATVSGKGGATKTTTNANLAKVLSNMGYNVLMVDVDQQSNLTINYGAYDEEQLSIAELMLHQCDITQVIRKTKFENISIIPGVYHKTEKAQAVIEWEDSEKEDSERYERLLDLKQLDEFDFILYDCPPSLNSMTMNVLAVCDYVLAPVVIDAFGVQGVRYIVDKVDLIRESVNPTINMLGIFIAQDINTSFNESIKVKLKEDLGEKMLSTAIPFSKLVGKCSFYQEPVTHVYPKYKVSQRFVELTREILNKIK